MLRIISISDSYCKILKIGIITCNIRMKKLHSLRSYPILVINSGLLQKCCKMFSKMICQNRFLFVCFALFILLNSFSLFKITSSGQPHKRIIAFSKVAELSLYQIALEFNLPQTKWTPSSLMSFLDAEHISVTAPVTLYQI